LLQLVDEIFAIAPLGKILIGTKTDVLNKMLGFSSDTSDLLKKAYEPVDAPSSKRQLVKIVSTTREGTSVLRDHSALLKRALGDHATIPMPDEITEGEASVPIKEVKHLLFPFDKFSDRGADMQREIELPHELTRTPEFMARVFSIRLPSRVA
jgi:hypothetical protein